MLSSKTWDKDVEHPALRNRHGGEALSLKNNPRTMECGMADKQARGRHEDPPDVENPKTHPDLDSNQQKDPDDWVTGHEPMTGAQASYLKTLSEQAHDPDAYDPELSKAEASKRIDELKQKTGR
jgi:hypothetical protein